MKNDTLVSWKRVIDCYGPSDRSQDVKKVEFTEEVKPVKFIMNDETNAKAMRLLKTKW